MTNLTNTEDATGEMSTTNMIVWLVRIALPILFFFIWYRSGPGKESSPGSQKHRRSREELLDARSDLGNCSKPEELSNLKMADAPEPTSVPPRNSRNNQAARSKRGDKSRNSGGSDYLGFKQDRTHSSEFDLDFDGETNPSNIGIQSIAPPAVPKVGRASLNAEELSQFESLLNFAALAHKGKSKPMFLCTNERPPPPPPRKVPLATLAKTRQLGLAAPPVSSETTLDVLRTLVAGGDSDSPDAFKSDCEAQTILKALVNEKIGLKCPDMAKDLYTQLSECDARITEPTFTLIVEACVNAGDLKGASNFLMKMETNSFSPDSELLDKVMDLYSVSRSTETATVTHTPETTVDVTPMVPERQPPIEEEPSQKKSPPWVPERQPPIEEEPSQKKSPPWVSGKSSQKNKLVNSSTGDPMETREDSIDEIRQVPDPQCSPIPGDDLDDDIFEPEDSGFTRQISQDVEVAEVHEQPTAKEEKPDESERLTKPTKKADRKARKGKDRADQQKNDDETLDEAFEAAKAEREEARKEELREEASKKETGKKRWADEEAAKLEAVRKKELAEHEAAERQAAVEKAAKAARELEAQRAAEERERVTNSLDSLTASCAEELPSKPEPKGRKDKSSSEKKKKDKGGTPKAATSVIETAAIETPAEVEVESKVSPKNEKDDAIQEDVAPDPQVAVSEVTAAEESFDTGCDPVGYETAVTGKQKKASRAQQRAEEKEAKRKEEEEQESKRAAQETARAAEEAARVAEEAARAAQETARSVQETVETTTAPVAKLPNSGMSVPVQQFFQAAKAAEAKQQIVSSLPEKEGGSDRTPLEKEIMKLEKKLREVEKLKEKMEAGETLAPNQLEKVTKFGDTLGPKIAELQLQRALERAQDLQQQAQFQEDRQSQDPPQDFEVDERPEYSPGTPEPGDLPPIPMQPPTRTPLRQWARDARGATPFVGTPGFGPGVMGKGMPQVSMVGFAPQGKGFPQDGDGSNGMPHPGMTAPFCVPCPPANGDMRTPLALPQDHEGNPPQFVPMFGGPPIQGLNGEVTGAPVLCMPSMDMFNDQVERWEGCWEWMRSGWCPRGVTCRWEHPPLTAPVDFENGLHMQQLWPDGEMDPGGPPRMVLVSTGLPGGDFAPIPNGMAMPPLAAPMVPMGEDESAQQEDMPVTPRDDM